MSIPCANKQRPQSPKPAKRPPRPPRQPRLPGLETPAPASQADAPIVDQLVRSRRKTLALVVLPDGKLIVRAPLRLPEEQIWAFIAQKAGWIRARQRQAAQNLRETPVRRFTAGEKFLFLGQSYDLEIVSRARPPLELKERFLLSQSAQARAVQVFEAWYRQQARQMLPQRVQHFSSLHGFKPSQVRITSARTRWGSCSGRGVLSFTWRLIMAPPAVIDYVVIHELVHLEIKNHSQEYWARVAQLMPDHKQRRAWLKTNRALCDLPEVT